MRSLQRHLVLALAVATLTAFACDDDPADTTDTIEDATMDATVVPDTNQLDTNELDTSQLDTRLTADMDLVETSDVMDSTMTPDLVADMAVLCGGVTCGMNESCCNDTCVDLSADDSHCGRCDNFCPMGETCMDGGCSCGVDLCSQFQSCCGAPGQEACIDVFSDQNHCGACGNACEAGEVCYDGVCACPAPGGGLELCSSAQTCCGGQGCRLTDVDPQSCGGCGIECGAGELCINGQCTCGSQMNTGAVCASGESCCGSPPSCLPADASECSCGTSQCGSGQECCDLQGGGQACASTWREVQNCGACGNVCGLGETCRSATCVCHDGLGDCDGDPNNGCETVLAVSNSSCGLCGSGCAQGEVCNGAGVCALICQDGMVECDGECVNLNWNRGHCGACNNACGPGEVANGAGVCAATCLPGLTDCDGQCVDLDSNNYFCGGCGIACAPGEVCNGLGQCALSCVPGRIACGGECVDLGSDSRHCGSCGSSCGVGEICNGLGQCAANCTPGTTDCSGLCVSLESNRNNCGACGTRCAAAEECVAGQCTLQCAPGLISCAGQCVDPGSNNSHCGQCGNACSAPDQCVTGACALVCPPGTVECSNQCVDPMTDPLHCGMCDNDCTPGICDQGGCCPAGGCTGSVTGFEQIWGVGDRFCGRAHPDPMSGNRQLYCWGSNDILDGQKQLLGAGVVGRLSNAPVALPLFDGSTPGSTVVAAAGGSRHTCVATEKDIWCWGEAGQSGTFDGAAISTPTQIGTWDTGSPADNFDGPIVELDADRDATCGRTTAGSVYCWGALYNPHTTNASERLPLRIEPNLDNNESFFVLQVEVGDAGGAACVRGLPSDGTGSPEIWCWNRSSNRSILGCGNDPCPAQNWPAPVSMAGGMTPLTDVANFSMGARHACAIIGSDVWCWGEDSVGELGRGCTYGVDCTGDANPTQVVTGGSVDLTGVRKLVTDGGCASGGSTSPHATCALLADGTVSCWGTKERGQLGRGCTMDDSKGCTDLTTTQIHSSADGLVEVAPGVPLTNVIDIVAGCASVCALHANGDVSCWGNNELGALGHGQGGDPSAPTALALTGMTQIESGGLEIMSCAHDGVNPPLCWFSVERPEPSAIAGAPVMSVISVEGARGAGIDANGGLWEWTGAGFSATADTTYDGTNAVAVAVKTNGSAVTCVIDDAGAVDCWSGVSDWRDGEITSGAVELSIGSSHECARLDTGAVQCWGYDSNYGQLGNSATFDTGEMIVGETVVGLDGTTAAASAVSISTYGYRSCAATEDGQVLCWGRSQELIDPMQIGGVPEPIVRPEFGPGLLVATAVDVSNTTICASTDTGALYCWGKNMDGELGTGVVGSGSLTAIQVDGIDGVNESVVDFNVGNGFTCAILDTGETRCWGRNEQGQLGIDGGLWSVTPRTVAVP